MSPTPISFPRTIEYDANKTVKTTFDVYLQSREQSLYERILVEIQLTFGFDEHKVRLFSFDPSNADSMSPLRSYMLYRIQANFQAHSAFSIQY